MNPQYTHEFFPDFRVSGGSDKSVLDSFVNSGLKKTPLYLRK